MKSSLSLWRRRLVIACALASLPHIVLAQSMRPADNDGAPQLHAAADRGDGCGARPLPPEMPGPGMPPELLALHRIALSEAQQEAVFELMHAQIPVQRALEKKASKALNELRRLAQSDAFNARQAHTLADAHAQAVAQLAYNRADLDSKLRALLSPEQRHILDSAGSVPDQLPEKHGKGFDQPPGKP